MGRGARPVCLLVLGLGWEVGRGDGGEEGGREEEEGVGWRPPLSNPKYATDVN